MTRPDLAREKEDEFQVTCDNCSTSSRVHVNKVKAKPNPMILLVSIAISIIATIGLWNTFGAVATVTFAIPFIIHAQQLKSANAFNSYRVR